MISRDKEYSLEILNKLNNKFNDLLNKGEGEPSVYVDFLNMLISDLENLRLSLTHLESKQSIDNFRARYSLDRDRIKTADQLQEPDEYSRIWKKIVADLPTNLEYIMDIVKKNFSALYVFISYANEDIKAAVRLYKQLKIEGLEPWLDRGEEEIDSDGWKNLLKRALQNSRYFISLWSMKSFGNDGLMQRELKAALEILNEYRSSDISVIHVRLENCQLSDLKMNDAIIIDMFPDWNNGVQRVLQTILGTKVIKNQFEPNSDKSVYKEKGNVDEVYWSDLIKFIKSKQCIPFIGAGAHLLIENEEPLIPSARKIAEEMIAMNKDLFKDFELANEWIKEIELNPLLDDTYQLARVSQFLAMEKRNEKFPKLQVSKYVESILAPDFSSEQFMNTSYAALADLDLPIYVTSNFDLTMEEALISRSKGKKNPVSGFSRWNNNLRPMKSLGFDKKYQPTVLTPFVFHLHGYTKVPESLVLTERDYLEFVNYFNKEKETDIYPLFMIKQLSSSSLLFIGYRLHTMTFSSIFQGALSFLKGKPRPTSLSVQLLPGANENISSEKIINYLNEYNKDMFDIQVYLGKVSDFVKDLRDGIS
jgi:hypothetical protein